MYPLNALCGGGRLCAVIRHNSARLFLTVAFTSLIATNALGGVPPCDCSGDVDGNGVLDPGDLSCVEQGIDDPLRCPGGDVNCDGVIDSCDYATIECLLPPNNGGPACCDVPCGACCAFCKSLDGTPGAVGEVCRQTTQAGCNNGVQPGPAGGMFCQPGIYVADGASCTPSPCDCNGNGVPDGDDIDPTDPDGDGLVSDDCNDNGVPDECEFPDPNTVGACCIPGVGCGNTNAADCATAGGIYHGACTSCDVQNIAIIIEPGGEVFIHNIGPPGDDCAPPAPLEGPCPPNQFIDAWASPPSFMMCHDFNAPSVSPIPADFFGPGSDPFTGTVCLQGAPLGPTTWGDFGAADTLILRTQDPFDRCDLPGPNPVTVDIEIVALNLVSVSPITVTFNGGQNPESWNVQVDLSSVAPPLGMLTAKKEHCNGGTYSSVLNVQPRFNFLPPGGGPPSTWDTGVDAPDPPIQLQQNTVPAPWVSDVVPWLGLSVDPCSDFHGGISEAVPTTACDCDGNLVRDKCDIEQGAPDADGNGVPDVCEGVGIPTVSEWGMLVMGVLLFTIATIVIRRRGAVVA